MVQTLEDVTHADSALVIGIGGGGDVVSTIATARLLELLDVEVVLGGVIWIPVPRDVRPGPRSIDELEHVEAIEECIARVSPTSTTIDGIALAEAHVASAVTNEVFALDITAGVEPLASSLESFVADRDIDLVIGVDAGGDALARGDEEGLRSPLTDAVGLSVLAELSVPSILGVIGYGSDGELTQAELQEAVAELAGADALVGAWGVTPSIRQEVTQLLETVETEASRIPIEAATGAFGERSIRGGRRRATATPASVITYYFDPVAVADRSELVTPVRTASTLSEAADRLRQRGLTTEFDLERSRLEE